VLKKTRGYVVVGLLFGVNDKWTKEGVCDLKHLVTKINKHEDSKKHRNNFMSFQLLGKLESTTRRLRKIEIFVQKL
jgi:hypothetical protein